MVKLFFMLSKRNREVKLKKLDFHSSFSLIFLSQPYMKLSMKLFCKIIFLKQYNFTEKITRNTIFKKKNGFSHESEPWQIGP